MGFVLIALRRQRPSPLQQTNSTGNTIISVISHTATVYVVLLGPGQICYSISDASLHLIREGLQPSAQSGRQGVLGRLAGTGKGAPTLTPPGRLELPAY